MGLRINTNIGTINALRNLQVTDRSIQRSIERLSSGLRINRGADDPSGMVISERLRLQIAALNQDARNSQNAANLVATADAALGKINDLLIEIQDSVQFALSTGSSSPDQIAAEQDSVDQAVAAIDRIANTTRYGDRQLLNGNSAYRLNSGAGGFAGTGPAFTNLTIRSLSFAPGEASRDVEVSLTTSAARATVSVSSNGGETTVLRITGARGTADITLASSATSAAVGSAINAVANQTGIFYSVGEALSEGFGEDEFISVEVVSGTHAIGGAGSITSDVGVDGVVSFNGASFTGKGLDFSIQTADASLAFSINPEENGLGSVTLSVQNTGLMFQLRENAQPGDQLSVGISSVTAASLGFFEHDDEIAQHLPGGSATAQIGGFLTTLKTGGDNDLTNNADNALNIVRAASSQVAQVRGFLGATVGFNIEPNIDSIGVAVENLSASMSAIRDLDFAAETADFTRTQILFQSGVAALASARIVPQSVLQLLG